MSDLEVLDSCIRRLNSIRLPVALLDEVGLPIKSVTKDLEAIVKAIIAAIQEEQTEKSDAPKKEEKVVTIDLDEEETEYEVDDLSEAGERTDPGGMPGGSVRDIPVAVPEEPVDERSGGDRV